MKYAYSLTALLFIGISVTALSHPHFNKSLKATLPSKVEASVSYYTVPANMSHIEKIKVGGFVPSHATLSLSGAASSGSTSVSAGEYTIGAIRGSTDWTLVLHPKLAQGHTPDPSKLIRLESWFSTSEGTAHHSSFDVMPGHGSLAGKATLIWHFGNLYLAGVLE